MSAATNNNYQWAPQVDSVKVLTEILEQNAVDGNHSMKNQNDYFAYLAYIFHDTNAANELRIKAGKELFQELKTKLFAVKSVKRIDFHLLHFVAENYLQTKDFVAASNINFLNNEDIVHNINLMNDDNIETIEIDPNDNKITQNGKIISIYNQISNYTINYPETLIKQFNKDIIISLMSKDDREYHLFFYDMINQIKKGLMSNIDVCIFNFL